MGIARLLLLLVALVGTLAGGIWLGGHPASLPPQVRSLLVTDTGSLSAEAAALIESNYYRDVSSGQLENGSIAGMVRAVGREHGDRYSHYFDPEAMERFDEAISGSFTGVGLSVVEVPRGLRVGRVFRGTPAEGAGIGIGDVIVSVGGEPIAGVQAEAVTARIKGPEGTAVRLGIAEGGGGEVRHVRLIRRQIQLPPTRASLREVGDVTIGYLQLATFSRGAHRYVRRAVEGLRERGADGVLIDLRANGGGLLSEAILTTSLFLPEGETVVTTSSRTEGDREYTALGNSLPAGPIGVLINRDTASAAEILAAALSEELGAPLVGTRSFGKGVFQKVINLSNGGALDLTIGEYVTSSGVSLAEQGLEPDVRAVDDPDTGPDEAVARGLRVLRREVSGAGMPS